ncbi:hypothetical protein DACRYDRAFT_23396, partial [Dacryopinax primogenitus]
MTISTSILALLLPPLRVSGVFLPSPNASVSFPPSRSKKVGGVGGERCRSSSSSESPSCPIRRVLVVDPLAGRGIFDGVRMGVIKDEQRFRSERDLPLEGDSNSSFSSSDSMSKRLFLLDEFLLPYCTRTFPPLSLPALLEGV